jgi:uncharacterized protein YdhG (YjbR/CyaY superfamily)
MRKMKSATARNIDEYIAGFSPEIQAVLQKIRRTISQAAPGATEAISYGMPAFKLNGNLVFFAAQKHHIGFYPTPSGIVNFQSELTSYETSKGAIRFPLDRPIPYQLIEKITRFRVKEELNKAR